MYNREKLANLLMSSGYFINSKVARAVADHLIANGVTITVHCKECIYCNPDNHSCDRAASMESVYYPRKPTDFCSYGERFL